MTVSYYTTYLPYSYTLTLRVTDNNGATSVAFTTVTVTEATNSPPVADSDGPYSGIEGNTISLDGSASYDPVYDI